MAFLSGTLFLISTIHDTGVLGVEASAGSQMGFDPAKASTPLIL